MYNKNKTNLELINKYSDIIIKVINQSKFMKRAENKTMSTPKLGDSETHLCTRATHVRQTADIGKELAQALGLNEELIEIGMLMHDAGHPFTAHEGEELLTNIGRLYKNGYYHHNARGLNVILSEDIIQRIVNEIPEIRNNKALQKQFEEEFYYLLDVVISHDGEITRQEEARQKQIKIDNTKTMKTRVHEKERKANSCNKYKFLSETPEGQLAKPADIIAYLRTDMVDAYILGYIKKFSDDFLEQIGTILVETDKKRLTREEKIKGSKEIIQNIKRETMFEGKADLEKYENQEVVKDVNRIISEIERMKIDTYYLKEEDLKVVEKVIQKHLARIKKEQQKNSKSDNAVNAYINKIKECTRKMLTMRKSVIDLTMNQVQRKLIEDYINNSKGKEITEMGFSERISCAIHAMKDLDYKEFVQYNRREYQRKTLPESVLKLTNQCAEALIKTGIIRDKFFDKAVIKEINDKKILKHLKVKKNSEIKYEIYKKALGLQHFPRSIKQFRIFNSNKKFVGKFSMPITARRVLYRNIYDYTAKQEIRFARTCKQVYEAIPNTVNDMLRNAINPQYEPLLEAERKEIYRIRKELREMFGQYGDMAIDKNDLLQYRDKLIEKERNDLERKVAQAIAIEYIAGMTDEGILHRLIRTGNLDKNKLKRERERTGKINQRLVSQGEKKQNPNKKNFRMGNKGIPPFVMGSEIDGLGF